jgi:hypothetical protein
MLHLREFGHHCCTALFESVCQAWPAGSVAPHLVVAWPAVTRSVLQRGFCDSSCGEVSVTAVEPPPCGLHKLPPFWTCWGFQHGRYSCVRGIQTNRGATLHQHTKLGSGTVLFARLRESSCRRLVFEPVLSQDWLSPCLVSEPNVL